MSKAAMLWNWAILRCSIIEGMDTCWTETLLTKLQFLYHTWLLETVDCHVFEVLILSKMIM